MGDRVHHVRILQTLLARSQVPEEDKKIILYKRRWFMLFLFSTLSASNGINWLTYAPIATTVIREYQVNAWHINVLSLSYMILFIPGIFPASNYIDHYGLHSGFIVGGALNGLGGLIRVLPWPFASISESAPYSIIPVYIGQFVTAAAQPFILGLPPKLSQNWFGEHERVTATAIGALANQIGVALAFFFCPIVVPTADGNDWDITLLMIYTAIISVASFILIVLFFKSRPKTSPSRSSLLLSRNTEKYSQLHVVKCLAKDVNYQNIFHSFGIVLGVFFAITTVLEQMLVKADFPPNTTIVLGTILVLIGMFGAMLFGWLADRTRAYKTLIIICIVFSFLPSVVFAIVFWLYQRGDMGPWLSSVLLYAAGALMGFFMTALLPLCMDLSVEITFPLPEATVSNILMLSTQFYAIVFIIIFTIELEYFSVDSVNVTMVVSLAVICFVILFFRGQTKRLSAEAEKN